MHITTVYGCHLVGLWQTKYCMIWRVLNISVRAII